MSREVCLVLFLCPLLCVAQNASKELAERIIPALQKILDYFHGHMEDMNMDAIFGLMFTQVNLESLPREGMGDKFANRILDPAKGVDQNLLSVPDKIFFRFVVNAKLWERNTTFLPRNFENHNNSVANSLKQTNCDTFVKDQESQIFLEPLSDECLLQIIKTSIIDPGHCRVDDLCVDYMINGSYMSAYGITHRLLFLQIARIRMCGWSEQWLKERTRQYCADIYSEAKKYAECGFSPSLDDLFLEQILLCGYEGYADFFKREWMDHVLHIQANNGCFGFKGAIKRKRRSANLLADGCVDHTTGLGSAVLSLFLRYLSGNPDAPKEI